MTRLKTSRFKRPLAAFSGALLVLLSSAAVNGVPADQSMRPPDGNLLLKGMVQSVTTTQRIVMTVTDVTLPDGETFPLSPTRTKQVVVSGTTKIHVRGNSSESIQVDDLKDVQKGPFQMLAIGSDQGPGTDLAARDISVWTGFANGKYEFQKP